MGVPVSFLGTGVLTGLGSAISLSSGERYICIPWSDVDDAISSTSYTPDTLEDWLAAITYTLIDKTLADTNSAGAKLTAGRRFAVGSNGKGIDEGSFESGIDLAVYSAVIALYAVDSNPSRPTATIL